MKVLVRTRKEILVAVVELREIPNEIPDVGSDPELIDSSDIDCDTHGITGVIIIKTC